MAVQTQPVLVAQHNAEARCTDCGAFPVADRKVQTMKAFLIVLVLTGNGWGYFPIMSFPDRTTCEQARESVIATDPARGHAIRYHAMCVQPTPAAGV